MKIRPAASGPLDEAMEMVEEVNSFQELISYVQKYYPFWHPDVGGITISKYGDGIDERNGWDTYLVCVSGNAVLFMDGPLVPKEVSDEDREKRKQALELIGHPLNRDHFETVVAGLKDNGFYWWVDMEMSFTRDEIKQVLEKARKKES